MKFTRLVTRTLTVFFCTLVLHGCATMGEEECILADWYTVGLEDGSRGKPVEYLGEHRTACAKYGVRPDTSAYEQGREQGLQEYCNASNGFHKAKAGHTYHGVCPGESELDFLAGYDAGRELYALQQRIDTLQNQLYSNKTRIKEIRQRTRKKENQLIADQTSSQQRQRLLNDIRYLREEIGSLQENTYALQHEIRLLKHEYDRLNSRHAY